MNDLREAFFDQVGEILVIFDKDMRFADVNDNFIKTVNLKREEIIGRHITQVSPGIEKTERYHLYKQVLATGEPLFIDETRTHPNLGNYVSRINVFKLGEGIGMAIQNISDLREAIDELETFIYKSSHDLRGPISSILGLANLAVKETSREINALYFAMVKQKAEKLDFILNQLMETASIRKEEKTIRLIDFNEIIAGVKDSLNTMNGYNDIRFEEHVSVAQRFYSDKRLLKSIFQNLIDNAIKYKREQPGSRIRIEVKSEEAGVKITISDNGIGIAEALQGEVFNMFFRATERAEGAGLGLFTVKYAVRKLEGYITLSSKENEDTVFSVFLPNSKIHEYRNVLQPDLH